MITNNLVKAAFGAGHPRLHLSELAHEGTWGHAALRGQQTEIEPAR